MARDEVSLAALSLFRKRHRTLGLLPAFSRCSGSVEYLPLLTICHFYHQLGSDQGENGPNLCEAAGVVDNVILFS
jgi:hypothetical protein